MPHQCHIPALGRRRCPGVRRGVGPTTPPRLSMPRMKGLNWGHPVLRRVRQVLVCTKGWCGSLKERINGAWWKLLEENDPNGENKAGQLGNTGKRFLIRKFKRTEAAASTPHPVCSFTKHEDGTVSKSYINTQGFFQSQGVKSHPQHEAAGRPSLAQRILCSCTGTNGATPEIVSHPCNSSSAVCNLSWNHAPGSCSSLQNPTILTWYIFKLPCTELHNLLGKKKKSVFFAFCFSNMPSLFLSPLLFMTPLCCLCHWGIHPRVPIISDSLPGPANPSAVTAPHNSHFVNNHNPHSDSISAHSTHKWKNSFLRRN